MCTGGTPKYTPPQPPAEPPKAPKLVDSSVVAARNTEKQQARMRAGRSGTVLTNPTLTGQANTGAAGKTLLGQ